MKTEPGKWMIPALGAGLWLTTLTVPCAGQPSPRPGAEGTYQSPYSVKFSYPLSDLIGDIESGRGDPRLESSVPFTQWYSAHSRKEFGVWGPPARHYPPVPGAAQKPLKWKRERVVATAQRFVGYSYQHHHIPDWEPPPGWPWKEVHSGHNGKGVDCSNFTAFVYNLSFGIKPTGAVKAQSHEHRIPGPGNSVTQAELIQKPESYADFAKTLQPGDLCYIRSNKGEISHVVLWVGAVGVSPEDAPLLMDSHGETVKDSNGVTIPNGIQLRPFREHSWYHNSFDHALRILH